MNLDDDGKIADDERSATDEGDESSEGGTSSERKRKHAERAEQMNDERKKPAMAGTSRPTSPSGNLLERVASECVDENLKAEYEHYCHWFAQTHPGVPVMSRQDFDTRFIAEKLERQEGRDRSVPSSGQTEEGLVSVRAFFQNRSDMVPARRTHQEGSTALAIVRAYLQNIPMVELMTKILTPAFYLFTLFAGELFRAPSIVFNSMTGLHSGFYPRHSDDAVYSEILQTGGETLNAYLRSRVHGGLVVRPVLRRLRRVLLGPAFEDDSSSRANLDLMWELRAFEKEKDGMRKVFGHLAVPFVTSEQSRDVPTTLQSWGENEDDTAALYESVRYNEHNQETMGRLKGLEGPLDPTDRGWGILPKGLTFAVPLALPVCCGCLIISHATTRPVHVLLYFGRNFKDASIEIGGIPIESGHRKMLDDGKLNQVGLFCDNLAAPTLVTITPEQPTVYVTPNCLIICSTAAIDERDVYMSTVDNGTNRNVEPVEVGARHVHIDEHDDIYALVLGFHLNYATQAHVNGYSVDIERSWVSRTPQVIGIKKNDYLDSLDVPATPDGKVAEGGEVPEQVFGLRLQSKWYDETSEERRHCKSFPLANHQIMRLESSFEQEW